MAPISSRYCSINFAKQPLILSDRNNVNALFSHYTLKLNPTKNHSDTLAFIVDSASLKSAFLRPII